MQIVLNSAQFRDQTISGTFPLLKEIQPSQKPGFEFMTRIMYNGLRARVFFNSKDYNLLDDAVPLAPAPVPLATTHNQTQEPPKMAARVRRRRVIRKVDSHLSKEVESEAAKMFIDILISALNKVKEEKA